MVEAAVEEAVPVEVVFVAVVVVTRRPRRGGRNAAAEECPRALVVLEWWILGLVATTEMIVIEVAQVLAVMVVGAVVD